MYYCSGESRRDMNETTINLRLIQATERGDTAAVLQVIQAGAVINGCDDRGRTPVLAAVHGRRAGTVQALIRLGADINLQNNRRDNPFLYAGAEGLLGILKLLIDAGADTRLTCRSSACWWMPTRT